MENKTKEMAAEVKVYTCFLTWNWLPYEGSFYIIISVCTAEKQEPASQKNLSRMMKSNYNLRNRVYSLYGQAKKIIYRRLQV